MSEQLPEELQQAIATFRTKEHFFDVPEAIPSEHFSELGAFFQWKTAAIIALNKAKSQVAEEVDKYEQIVQQPMIEDERVWEQLEQACSATEELLTQPPSFQQRLEQGKRTLTPKLGKLLHDMLQLEISDGPDEVSMQVAPASLQQLKKAIDSSISAWWHHSLPLLTHDIEYGMKLIWQPRAGNLPVLPPALQQFTEPTAESLKLPFHVSLMRTTLRDAGMPGSGSRHLRTMLYGVMSIAILSTIRGELISTSVAFQAMLIVVVMVAVIYGVSLARAEQQAARKHHQQVLRQKAEQHLRDALSMYLTQIHDRLALHLEHELQQRHIEFVHWYRSHICPMRNWTAEKCAAYKREQAEAVAKRKPLDLRLQAIQDALTLIRSWKA